MIKRTTLALSAALVLGSASTALAQFYAPDVYVGPTPYGYYGAPYAYGPGGYDTWWSHRRFHQRRAYGDTNGF